MRVTLNYKAASGDKGQNELWGVKANHYNLILKALKAIKIKTPPGEFLSKAIKERT